MRDDAVALRWSRAAARAPGIAVRRWALRVILPLLTIPGIVQARNVMVWAWRTGQADVFAIIGLHTMALALAIFLPGRAPSVTNDSKTFLVRMRTRYSDRASRLNALGRAVLLELLITFAYPPIMMLVAGRRLQWPVYFVIAVLACIVVWPLERLARIEQREAERLTELDS